MKNFILIIIAVFTFSACNKSVENLPNLIQSDLGESIEGIVLIEFHQDFCEDCKTMDPRVKELKKEMEGKAKVIQICCGRTPLDEIFMISTIPTFIVFLDGKPLEKKIGQRSKRYLERMIERAEKERDKKVGSKK